MLVLAMAVSVILPSSYLKEEEVSTKTELLEQSESLRRRLHEQVTELQGQLAIEEQRSRFCVVL